MNAAHPATNDEVRYRVLKYLAEHPDASQRTLANHLGVSVGKVNYCLRGLITRGWISVRNFRNAKQKQAYLYVLTPSGLEEKVRATYEFLRRRMREYEAIRCEIERLKMEMALSGNHDD